MRVTAGKFKGRNLIDNKYEHIRPTADMVKQAIFNKLAFDLPNSRALDLFCGTGALGIEAISRGAREVVFIDKDPRSVALTKANLEKMLAGENGACHGKMAIAKKAKELNLDAIHDSVHEMARDEARHGKALEALLKRYF